MWSCGIEKHSEIFIRPENLAASSMVQQGLVHYSLAPGLGFGNVVVTVGTDLTTEGPNQHRRSAISTENRKCLPVFLLDMHFKTCTTQVDIASRTKEIRIVTFVYVLVAIPADVLNAQNLGAL